MNKKVNPRFRKLRRDFDYTQEQLANMVGRSRQWVSAVERGCIDISYDDTIILSKIYGGTPDMFLPDKDKKK